MSNYRSRPKGNYIQEATWEELYLLTESWKNDFELYLLEIQFLEQLIETYLVKLLIYENFDIIKELQLESKELKNRGKNMLKHLRNHLLWIIEIIDESYYEKNHVLRGQQESFEEDISCFAESLKIIRYIIYGKLKDILEQQQPKFIWKYN